MYNFAALFNQMRGPQTQLNLSDLINDPNVTVQSLLGKQTFINEFKSDTYAINQFMNYKRFSELISIVTQIGDPKDTERSFRFPLTVCQLLTSENLIVFEYVLPETDTVTVSDKIIKTTERQVQQEVEADDDDQNQEATVEPDDKKQKGAQAQPESTSQDAAIVGDEEEFGDFVKAPPKKKKIVKVKEIVQNVEIVKTEFPPLINSLLNYFSKEINYTLTGYVCKILTVLLNKKTVKFLSKLFSTPEYCQNILNHIASRSAVELIVRICTIERKQFIQQRYQFYLSAVQRLSIPAQIEVLSNLSACACQTLQKITIQQKSINPIAELNIYINHISDLIKIAISNIIGQNQKVSIYSVPFVYQLLNSSTTQLSEKQNQNSLKILVQGGFSKLQKTIISKQKRLGMGRVKLVQILSMLFKKNWVREWAANKQNFFSVLLSLVRQYPLNNILHNEIFKIIVSSMSLQTPTLTQNLLLGDKLLLWLQEQATIQEQRLKSLSKNSPKGYAAHLVNLCRSLREAAGANTSIRQLIEDNRFLHIIKVLIQKEVTSYQRNLAGYAMLKKVKSQILYSKEEILQQHAAFLGKAPPSVFPNYYDDPMQNPAILQELQHQLDGQKMQDPFRPTEIVEQQKHKAQLIEQNDQHKSAFWKVHLEYDVDSLMGQLEQ